MEKKERFQKAYAYLFGKGVLHSKQDLADILGSKRPSVSHAYNGDPKYLNDTFLRRFCSAFPDTFNLKWLLTGEGDMLIQQAPSSSSTQSDIVAQLLRMVNNLSEDVRGLKSELEATKLEVLKLKRAHYASVAADGGGN